MDEANLAITIARFGLDRSRPVVAFCPGAEFGPAKRWPTRHFAALARALAARGRRVWLIGSPGDRASGDEIAKLANGAAINLCGRTDLAASIDLLSVAEVVVSNDSGLMHVAAALGRPLVALYGSSSPAHTPPLAPARLVSRSSTRIRVRPPRGVRVTLTNRCGFAERHANERPSVFTLPTSFSVPPRRCERR